MDRLMLLVFALAGFAHAGEELLVLHKGDDSLGIYDAASGKLEAKIPTGKKPHEFALSADERYVYVTNYGADTYTETQPGGNTITVIDLWGRKVDGEIGLGEYHRPHGIDRGKSGLFYVTTDFPAAVLVVDGKKRKVVHAIKLTSKLPHMVQVTQDERAAWTADAGSGTVTAIDLHARRQRSQMNVGGVPMGLALTPDEKRLFVATRTNNMVVVIDAVVNKIRRNIGVPGMASRLAMSRNGRFVYASLIESGEVAAIDVDTLLEVKRVTAGARVEGILLAPDGEALYVSAQGDNKVLKFSAPGLDLVQTLDTLAKPDPLYLLGQHQRAAAPRRESK